MVWGDGLSGRLGLHLWNLLVAVVCTGGLGTPMCRLGVRWCALGNVNVHREPLCDSEP